MSVAGINAHATYLVVAVVSKTGELLQEPTRIANGNAAKLLALLGRFGPIEAVSSISVAGACSPEPAGAGCASTPARSSAPGSSGSCAPTGC